MSDFQISQRYCMSFVRLFRQESLNCTVDWKEGDILLCNVILELILAIINITLLTRKVGKTELLVEV